MLAARSRWSWGALLGLVTTTLAWGTAPQPAWQQPDYPGRYVVAWPHKALTSMLVAIPRERGLGADSAWLATDPRGQALPVRTIHIDEREVTLLVSLDEAQRRGQAIVYLAPAIQDAALPPDTSPDAGQDATPMALEVRGAGSRKPPPSWDRMHYAWTRGDSRARMFAVKPGGRVEQEAKDTKGRRRRAPSVLMRADIWVRPPVPGRYRLAFDAPGTGYMLVDGELASPELGIHGPGNTWQTSRALDLDEGIHHVEVFLYGRLNRAPRLGWQPPDADAIRPIPAAAMLSGVRAANGRLEWKDRALYPDFAVEPLDPYRFRHRPDVFLPVRLSNRSISRVSDPMTCRWEIGPGRYLSGTMVTNIFTTLDLHTVTLHVRDGLGFEASLERTIDLRYASPTLVGLRCGVEDVAPILFVGETAHPTVRIHGDTKNKLAFEWAWQATDAAGAVRVGRQVREHAGGSTGVPLGPCNPETRPGVTWSVNHAGIEIWNGTLRFVRPPFDWIPATIQGDRLYAADGTRLVLVPYRFEGDYRQARIETAQAFGRIFCADDFLAPPGRRAPFAGHTYFDVLQAIVNGPDAPLVDHDALPTWKDHASAYGPLLKLVHVPGALRPDTDVVILSIGLRDMLWRQNAVSFERTAAALTDILSTTLGRPVLWVTPPPFPDMTELAREYAAAVQRIADARHIPVADLFSAFSGGDRPSRFFDARHPLGLTERAQRLAGLVIARALLQE